MESPRQSETDRSRVLEESKNSPLVTLHSRCMVTLVANGRATVVKRQRLSDSEARCPKNNTRTQRCRWLQKKGQRKTAGDLATAAASRPQKVDTGWGPPKAATAGMGSRRVYAHSPQAAAHTRLRQRRERKRLSRCTTLSAAFWSTSWACITLRKFGISG